VILVTLSPTTAACWVRPVVIESAARRFVLLPSGQQTAGCWTVPSVPVSAGEPYAQAAAQWLCRRTGLSDLRIAPVVGVLPSVGARRRTEYVVLVRPAAAAWADDVCPRLDAGARCWTLDELHGRGVDVEPETLPLLLEGYWDGWLPDGEVSLE
jgi:ADP-ribose pyrophosphatase YjhB (NUDIX family)